MIVLDISTDEIYAKEKADCLLEIPKIKEGTIGNTLIPLDKKEQKRIENILALFANSALTEKLSRLNLTEAFGITAVVSDLYTVHLGNEEKLSQKLALCQKSIRYLETHMSRVQGILYARTPKEISFIMTGVALEK